MFTIFYLLLAFFTGGIIPFQTAANSNLKQQMSSPLLASFVNCTVGSIALFIFMMLSTEESFYRSPEEWASYDWWMYTSGALGAIILMVAMTLLIKLGMVGTSLATMTGMMVTGMVLDEFGAFGMPVHEFDAIRAIGLVIMILGVMAALRVFAHIKQHAATFSLFTVLWFLLGCFSGSLLATQAAINAVFRVELHSVLYCALISMVSTSAIVLVSNAPAQDPDQWPLVAFHWWFCRLNQHHSFGRIGTSDRCWLPDDLVHRRPACRFSPLGLLWIHGGQEACSEPVTNHRLDHDHWSRRLDPNGLIHWLSKNLALRPAQPSRPHFPACKSCNMC